MKRPDGADTPDDRSEVLSRSRASSVAGTQQLEELNHHPNESEQLISNAVHDINNPSSNEFSMLSESNHAYRLIESFKSSSQARSVQTKIGQLSGGRTAGPYSVRVDSPSMDASYQPMSILQFLHEFVSGFEVFLRKVNDS